MFARLFSQLAAASLTLGALACAQHAWAQTGALSNLPPTAQSRDAHLAATGGGLRASLHAMPSGRHGSTAGYGLRASGSASAEPLGSSALMAESMRTGSLRADIARYNAERAGHGLSAQGSADGGRPSPYSSNVY